MKKILEDFVANENKIYRFKLGTVLASSLTGFVAGAVMASIIWFVAVYYLNNVLAAGL